MARVPEQRPLKLKAEDAEDLAIIAACLQDAVVRRADMTYLPRQRRFALVLNRFRWENEDNGRRRRLHERVACGMHFDSVLSAQSQGIDLAKPDQVLELLTVACEEHAEGAAEIGLIFAGGGVVKLSVECVDCHLSDIGQPWKTPRRPAHNLEPGG